MLNSYNYNDSEIVNSLIIKKINKIKFDEDSVKFNSAIVDIYRDGDGYIEVGDRKIVSILKTKR